VKISKLDFNYFNLQKIYRYSIILPCHTENLELPAMVPLGSCPERGLESTEERLDPSPETAQRQSPISLLLWVSRLV